MKHRIAKVLNIDGTSSTWHSEEGNVGAFVRRGLAWGNCRVGDAAVEQELVYEKMPSDIAERSVLLMDPMLGSGSSAAKAIEARSNGSHQPRRHDPA